METDNAQNGKKTFRYHTITIRPMRITKMEYGTQNGRAYAKGKGYYIGYLGYYVPNGYADEPRNHVIVNDGDFTFYFDFMSGDLKVTVLCPEDVVVSNVIKDAILQRILLVAEHLPEQQQLALRKGEVVDANMEFNWNKPPAQTKSVRTFNVHSI